MLTQRRYNAALVELQLTIRQEMLGQLLGLDGAQLGPVLAREALVQAPLAQLVAATQGSADAVFFANYQFLVRGIYHFLRWAHQELHAEAGAEAQRRAVGANARRIQVAAAHYPAPFRAQLLEFIALLTTGAEALAPEEVAQAFCRLAFPVIYAFEVDPLAELRRQVAGEPADPALETPALPLVISAEFVLDDEPWTNPQVLRPAKTYTVRGTLTPNYWPAGYDRLLLMPLSTTSRALYTLALPEIHRTAQTTPYEITGQVVFPYPQSNFADSMAIGLLAYYANAQNEQRPAKLIGYTQLVAQVLDPAGAYFPTGFQALDRRVFDIVLALQQQLPGLDQQELSHFTHLLQGIVNYQGFCAQHGIYKEQNSTSEDTFRDNLIQHLVQRTQLGEHISKEAHLAGGRVEISFHGIVAELKVEKTISDRAKLLTKYGQQAAAYAAGNAKQLSIVCVLDLTPKTYAPAAPQNGILLGSPAAHGFPGQEPPFAARQVLVVIDGNTRKPSAYSR